MIKTVWISNLDVCLRLLQLAPAYTMYRSLLIRCIEACLYDA
jgi:hypothetical protein